MSLDSKFPGWVRLLGLCLQISKCFVPVLPTHRQGKLQGAGDARLEQGKGSVGWRHREMSSEPSAPATGTSQASAQAAGACAASAPTPMPFAQLCSFATSPLGDCLFLEEQKEEFVQVLSRGARLEQSHC